MYEKPEMLIYYFEMEDIVTLSGSDGGDIGNIGTITPPGGEEGF